MKREIENQNNDTENLQEDLIPAQCPSESDSGKLESRTNQLELANETLRRENEELNRSVAARFREIAVLTNLIESQKVRRKPAAFLLGRAKTWQQTVKSSNLPNRIHDGVLEYLKLKKHVKLVMSSGLLDSTWYLENNPDLTTSKKASKHPVWHYVKFGGFEGRDPSEAFMSTWYLENNPDVAAEGINPLVHYILNGKHEGRLPKQPHDYSVV